MADDELPQWHILSLPPELRLRIYEHIFNRSYHTGLLIRSHSKVELISLAKAHAAIIKTCRKIYHEATPYLYDATTFRVQIYPEAGYPSYGNTGHMSKNTYFLPRIRHLEIKASVMLSMHTKHALVLLKTFVEALEEADPKIETLTARSNVHLPGPMRAMMRSSSNVAAAPTNVASGNASLLDRVITAMDSQV
jgi:hypothetical protein